MGGVARLVALFPGSPGAFSFHAPGPCRRQASQSHVPCQREEGRGGWVVARGGAGKGGPKMAERVGRPRRCLHWRLRVLGLQRLRDPAGRARRVPQPRRPLLRRPTSGSCLLRWSFASDPAILGRPTRSLFANRLGTGLRGQSSGRRIGWPPGPSCAGPRPGQVSETWHQLAGPTGGSYAVAPAVSTRCCVTGR